MVDFLRRFPIRGRLIALGVVPLLLAAIVAGVAVLGFGTSVDAATSAQASSDKAAAALAMKYQAADWNGWQTAYAFDINRGVPNAWADDADSRKAYLASETALVEQMAALAENPDLTDEQRALLAEAKVHVDDFIAIDREIVSAYKSGTAEGKAKADDFIIVDEIENYNAAAAAFGQLADLTRAEAAADVQAAADAAARSKSVMIVLVVVGIVLVGFGVWTVIRSITVPLYSLRDRLADIADGDGDLTQRVAEDGKDEVTEVSSLFNRFVQQIADVIGQVAQSAQTVAAAAEELTATSHLMSSSAEATSQQAQVVAGRSENVNESVQTAATATDQLTASIAQISSAAWDAARVASTAVEVAQSTSLIMDKLGQSSADIDKVIKEIKGVADQTNLLALNATIESARAGEAGKGFAVVASEVKDLSRATATATTDITQRIQTITVDTDEAISAIGQISETIAQISEIQHSIASAVEEQTAAINEIARSMSEVANGSGQIQETVSEVTDAAQAASSGAEQTRGAARELAKMASDLEGLVGSFRY
jgi:methyl-accepting chemotaxis protein